MSEYPAHDRLKATQAKAEAIALFIDWLEGKGYEICEFGEHGDGWWPTGNPTPKQLVQEFFGIDPQALKDEKERMLDSINRRD